MEIKTKYNLDQIVYLKTDKDQDERIITAIKICTGGSILYTLAQGTNDTQHYECELCTQRNVIKALGLNGN